MNIDKFLSLKSTDDNEASFCPSHGGIITALKLKGKEILYFDEETFSSRESSTRGGIPILFPNAGELDENSIFPGLKRHGFARDMEWESELKENIFVEKLSSNEETRKVYPYDFRLSLSCKFEEDSSFTLSEEVENTGDKEMPVAMGLHPYFRVSDKEKKNIKFNFYGGEKIKDGIEIWNNSGTLYIDNPKLKDPNAVMTVDIPQLGTILINPSLEFRKIWIWSVPSKDFICIEPIMRDLNGLLDDPKMIKPKEVFKTRVNFKLV